MAKEFNLDDYQYVETVLDFDSWKRDYKPQLNSFNGGARFDGMLYEHQDEEWVHVSSQPIHNVWTLFRTEDGSLKIKNGLVVRGRIGYFLSEIQHDPHRTFVVTAIDDSMAGEAEEGSKLLTNAYKYRIIPAAALETYEENGMTAEFDVKTLNGELTIYAPDEETAELMRRTYTDIRMWEQI